MLLLRRVLERSARGESVVDGLRTREQEGALVWMLLLLLVRLMLHGERENVLPGAGVQRLEVR